MARTKEFEPDEALERAMNVFWQYGYDGTSMQMLVDHMDINRSSLYDTFGDKRKLYLAALDRYGQAVHGHVAAHFDQETPVREAFRRFFEEAVDTFASDPNHRGCFVSNATVDQTPHDLDTAKRTKASLEIMEEIFYRALAQAKERGELTDGQDPRRLARYLLNAFTGIRVTVKAIQDRSILQDIVDATLSILDEAPSLST